MSNLSSFLVTTTPSMDGYKIKSYLGPVTANIIAGTGLFSDIAASFTDVFGGRSESYQKQLSAINNEVIKKLITTAQQFRANAIVGLKLDFDEISGKAKQMFMVSATGTAVYVESLQAETDNKRGMNRIVTADELNDRLKILDILDSLEKGDDLDDPNDWNLLRKYKVKDAAKSIFEIILKLKSNPQESYSLESFIPNAKQYFLSFADEELKEMIYPIILDLEKILKLFYFVKEIVELENLLDFNYIMQMLESDSLLIKKCSLILLKLDKAYYTYEDIEIIKNIIPKFL